MRTRRRRSPDRTRPRNTHVVSLLLVAPCQASAALVTAGHTDRQQRAISLAKSRAYGCKPLASLMFARSPWIGSTPVAPISNSVLRAVERDFSIRLARGGTSGGTKIGVACAFRLTDRDFPAPSGLLRDRELSWLGVTGFAPEPRPLNRVRALVPSVALFGPRPRPESSRG